MPTSSLTNPSQSSTENYSSVGLKLQPHGWLTTSPLLRSYWPPSLFLNLPSLSLLVLFRAEVTDFPGFRGQ